MEDGMINVPAILMGENGEPHHFLGIGRGEINGKEYVSLTFHQIPEGTDYTWGDLCKEEERPEMFFSIAFGSVKCVDVMISQLKKLKKEMMKKEPKNGD